MLKSYRIKRSNNDLMGPAAEIHSQDCIHYDAMVDFEFIGFCTSSEAALSEAKRRGYKNAALCNLCGEKLVKKS